MARSPRPTLARSLPLSTPLRAVVNGRRNGVIVNDARPASAAETGLLDAAVDWALYRDGAREHAADFSAAVAAARDGRGFVWLGLHDPTQAQLEQLGEVFNLHP